MVINYTGRNIMGQSSRLFLTIDIAQQPKFRLQYQKIFGEKQKWWWRSDAEYQRLKNKIFLQGKFVDAMRFNTFHFNNMLNRNLNSLRSAVGIGIVFKNDLIKPLVDSDVADNVFFLDRYYYNNLEIYAQYFYSYMDKVLYPTRGTHFR